MYHFSLYEGSYAYFITSLLFLSGIISGIYHGIFNKQIYHPEEKREPKIHEKIHTFWIHLICGLIGSASLYILANKYLLSRHISATIGSGDFGLLIIGVLGLVGLGPMTLWFLVQAIIFSKNTLARIIGLPEKST